MEMDGSVEMYTGQWWSDRIQAYDKKFRNWINAAQKIERLYAHKNMGEKSASALLTSLYSTVEGMLLSQSPIPIVKRRFNTDDKLSRVAEATLQSALKAALDLDDDLEKLGESFMQDFFLVGRGTFWVSLEFPRDRNGDFRVDSDGNMLAPDKSPIEFVSWKDFVHDPFVESELDINKVWVARRKWMTPKSIAETYENEEFLNLSTGINRDLYMSNQLQTPEMDSTDEVDPHAHEVEVFEIWCPDTQTVYHLAHAEAKLLAEEDDPLHLQTFNPCVTGYWKTEPHSLIPIPQYTDVAHIVDELNELEVEIKNTSERLDIRGWVNTQHKGIAQVIEGTGGGKLISVNVPPNVSLNDAVQILDNTPWTNHLTYLHSAQAEREQRIYRSSGIPDIVRGSVHPNEKLGQSQIKAGEAGNRMGTKRGIMARTYRDTMSLKAELISEHYSPNVFRRLSGFDDMEDVKNWTIPKEQQDPENPNGPPIVIDAPVPPEQGILAVKQFLSNEEYRTYKLTFETDATALTDPGTRMTEASEVLSAETAWLEKIVLVYEAQPDLAELMLLGYLDFARKAGLGHATESRAEELLVTLRVRTAQMQQQAEQEGPPEPTMEEQEMQFKFQEMQLKHTEQMQKINSRIQQDELKAEQMRLNLERQRRQGIAESLLAQQEFEYKALINHVNVLKTLRPQE